jgi:glycosyltransferase involved in cell wall biosynthesis
MIENALAVPASESESKSMSAVPESEPGALDPARLLRAIAARMRSAEAPAKPPRVAVLLPCHDEARTIARVVADFRAALPAARILVYDNGSADGTARIAAAAGAEVRQEPRPGKGNVVRRMFADVDADVYVMADGDGTYDAGAAPRLVAAVLEGHVDMAVGARAGVSADAHRRGHALGNAAGGPAGAGRDIEDALAGFGGKANDAMLDRIGKRATGLLIACPGAAPGRRRLGVVRLNPRRHRVVPRCGHRHRRLLLSMLCEDRMARPPKSRPKAGSIPPKRRQKDAKSWIFLPYARSQA